MSKTQSTLTLGTILPLPKYHQDKPSSNKCHSLSYLKQDVSKYCDTSTYQFNDIHFRNITGNGLATPNDYPGKNVTFAISMLCSEKAPCKDLTFEDVDVQLPKSYKGPKVLCANAQVKGLKCDKYE